MTDGAVHDEAADPAVFESLLEVSRRCGTPTFAYNLRRLRAQVEKLSTNLPPEVKVLYSLKANASLGICEVFANEGLGADVASCGELATALAAGFPPDQIFVAGPFKLPQTIAQLEQLPDAVISVDSPSELEMLAECEVNNRLVLRLRPDFGSSAVVAAGRESRFGFTLDDTSQSREFVNSADVDVVGFHVYAGSQVLDAQAAVGHLRSAFELSQRAADVLGITPHLFNLGGGFGIPYAPGEQELDLAPIGDELAALATRARPARLVLELGRYLVGQAGWYLTTVLGRQRHLDREAVVVDGGTHQRADLCGLCLRTKARPPVALDTPKPDSPRPTDVLGILSLPSDVLAESALLPQLRPGHVLAFADAGAYGLWSSPVLFHGSALPAEAAFDGSTVHIMRERRTPAFILEGQRHLCSNKVHART
jgi:diaminopimelate decarboxylase